MFSDYASLQEYTASLEAKADEPGNSFEEAIDYFNFLDESYFNDNYLIALIGEENGGYPVVVGASKAANDKGYLAGKLVKDIASLLGGSGGGRPDLASGAGRDIAKLEDAKKILL